MLGLPGAPLLYYGDEYGQWGGSDPNNRLMWRPEASLSADEKATLAFTRKLGLARKTLSPMRRGDYIGLTGSTDDVLVFGRKTSPGDAAVVGVSRAATPQTMTIEVGAALGFSSGTVLKDALGGPDATVDSSGKVTFVVPARGAVMLGK